MLYLNEWSDDYESNMLKGKSWFHMDQNSNNQSSYWPFALSVLHVSNWWNAYTLLWELCAWITDCQDGRLDPPPQDFPIDWWYTPLRGQLIVKVEDFLSWDLHPEVHPYF